MRFQIEECNDSTAAQPCLPWVAPAITAIYGLEAEEASSKTAQDFLLAALGKPSSLLLLSREMGTKSLAGFLFLAPREDAFLGVAPAYVYLLFTLPQYRRLGVARDLLAKAEQLARAQGQKRLMAPATHNDDAIISMGERRGYLREREFMIKEL